MKFSSSFSFFFFFFLCPYFLLLFIIFPFSGADPGFRRGCFVHSEAGGGSYRNFRSGSKLLQGPGQINKQKIIADSRRGGPITPQKNLYPRMLLMTGVEEIMCDLTCTWTKRLVTWLVFGPNDLWLDLTWRLTKWLVTWLGLARKWLVTWLGLARKWLVTWLGLATNDLLPSLLPVILQWKHTHCKSGCRHRVYYISAHLVRHISMSGFLKPIECASLDTTSVRNRSLFGLFVKKVTVHFILSSVLRTIGRAQERAMTRLRQCPLQCM